MLVGDYIQMEEYDRAEELLAEIPDLGVDKRPMLTLLYRKQGKTEEAMKLTQRKLLQAAGDVQNCLIVLWKSVRSRVAMRGWNIMGENTEMWWSCWICGNTESMWRIIRLRWLKRMRIEPWNSWRDAGIYGEPWDLGKSRLYDKLAEQGADNGQQKEVFERMRNGMLKEIEKGEEFDFLRDRQEFKDLFAKFREAADRP
ncbi:MAG: hypothetical protein ACLRMZ_09235 [Blautia marasmi]